jgi:phytoene dehydrogenase-like protein
MSAQQPRIVIIGAGLAGLNCARLLHEAGISFTLLEAADGIGGRVRTDVVDGFRLDRGFQVFLPGYPEAQQTLYYEALDLRPFFRGAQIHWKGKTSLLADPLHHLKAALQSLTDDVSTWRDRWNTLRLRKSVWGLRSVPREEPVFSTEEYLRRFGFSQGFVDRFMRPFFGGVFCDKELSTCSCMFQFLFAMFDRAGTALPAKGMQAIPDLLAARLPAGCVRLNQRVVALTPGHITLESGEVIQAEHIILAGSEQNALELLPDSFPQKPAPMRSTTTLYFAANEVPSGPAILHLDGDNRGPVNHACVLSHVAPEYAPAGQHLISCAVLGTPSSATLEQVVREQMTQWFGPSVASWRHLRTYQLKHAQSESRQLHAGAAPLSTVLQPGLYRCGDYCEDVSINGALVSGRKAAKAVLSALS